MPRTTTTEEGSMGDRIDDALAPEVDGPEAVTEVRALLREIRNTRFMHPGVKSLEVKLMMLEEKYQVADEDSVGGGGGGGVPGLKDDVVERMRKMSVASQQRTAMQRAKEEAALFKPDIGRSAKIVGTRRGSIFDRMDEDTATQRAKAEAEEKRIADAYLAAASSPRQQAGHVSEANQKRHEALADASREKALGRRGSIFDLSDAYEDKRQREIEEKSAALHSEMMSPDAAKPKLSEAQQQQKDADAANGKAAWNRRDHEKALLEEQEQQAAAAEERAKADAERAARAQFEKKHKALTRRMSESFADSSDMRRAAKEFARVAEEAAKAEAEEEEERKRLAEVEKQRKRTEKVLANGRRKSIVEGGGLEVRETTCSLQLATFPRVNLSRVLAHPQVANLLRAAIRPGG